MAETKRKNVVEALAAVMAELPAIGKDSKAAPQQGGYAYRGIEAITQHVQPLFAKHGVVFVPRVMSYEIRDIIVNDKPWTDTVALIEYDVYGPGGTEDKITVGPLLAIGRDNSDKGGNKCATQAYKYALLQALCISDAKDDADQGSPEADQRRPREVIPMDPLKAKVVELSKAVKDEKVPPKTVAALIAEWFGEGKTTKDLDAAQLETATLGVRRYASLLRRLEGLISEAPDTAKEVIGDRYSIWDDRHLSDTQAKALVEEVATAIEAGADAQV